ncbi:MAG: hypothetical protein DHS20C14_03030 [Phycisphaeraceae bacterium]|nr:MAG: hypothetical protein DHS20C14_03030 [Phycisphaeraceae bacterium]
MARLTNKAARLVCALITISAVSAPALAAGPGYGNSRRGPSVRHQQIHKAGTLQIGRHYYTITERGVKNQMLDAFERAGYHAWVERGEVRVRTSRRYRSPSITWHAGSFNASVRYAGNCVIIKPYKRPARPAVRRPYGPRSRPAWNAPRWRPRQPACPW